MSSSVQIPSVPPYWSMTTAMCTFFFCISFITSEIRLLSGMNTGLFIMLSMPSPLPERYSLKKSA